MSVRRNKDTSVGQLVSVFSKSVITNAAMSVANGAGKLESEYTKSVINNTTMSVANGAEKLESEYTKSIINNTAMSVANGAEKLVSEYTTWYKDDYDKNTAKYERLRNLDFFVLDNSIRESTVGQLRGHTLENKWAIYNEAKKMKFKHIVVASFAHMTRVDDDFVRDLMAKGEDPSKMWAFSEITDSITGGVPDIETIPVGLDKLQEAGLYNVVFEIDLGDAVYNYNKFPLAEHLLNLRNLIEWTHNNLHKDAKVLVNFRDIMDVINTHPERVFEAAHFLTTLPEEIRLFGLIFEDMRGKALPDAIGSLTRSLRKIMDDNIFNGHLLVHVHEQFGFKDASTLESLMSGANGVWASACIEGAAMGAASSTITLMNLIRLGNKKVLKEYNCPHLRKCAINVTKITTGEDPFIKQPIYGERALDFVMDLNPDQEFDLAEFFEEKPIVRITTISSPEMIKTRLVDLFDEDPQFTKDRAIKMKELMLEDLRSGRKEEYMSPVGLALLFDRAGGKQTEAMADVIANMELNSAHADRLISEIRAIWDTWDAREAVADQGDEMLRYDSFYNGFMAPYFGCYRCWDTIKALSAIDMDADNQVDWKEFLVFLKWALHQYPDIKNTRELLDITFRKGIIPAMHDEVVHKKRKSAK